MLIKGHIAHRFLADPTLIKEIIETQISYTKRMRPAVTKEELLEAAETLFHLLSPVNNKSYIVTHTVQDHLDLFDAKQAMSLEGWKVFQHLPIFKKTFILAPKEGDKSTKVIRVFKSRWGFHFMHLELTHDKDYKITNRGALYWILFWVNFETGQISSNFGSEDVNRVAPFLYSLMAFTELSDTTEVVVPARQSYGTRKTFKLVNILDIPLTIINSNWNVTTIRSEGFPVRGHSAIRHTGQGRTVPRLVYIAPFEKKGYTRKAGKLSDNV